MKITTIGIDLAKNVFQVHGVDARGKVQLCKQLSRTQMQTLHAFRTGQDRSPAAGLVAAPGGASQTRSYRKAHTLPTSDRQPTTWWLI
jgi:hypothetical protein